jgi:hypothetical protein
VDEVIKKKSFVYKKAKSPKNENILDSTFEIKDISAIKI